MGSGLVGSQMGKTMNTYLLRAHYTRVLKELFACVGRHKQEQSIRHAQDTEQGVINC